jgi:hypothetical protein
MPRDCCFNNNVARALVRAGHSQHIGQALSQDKVVHWLMPVVWRLFSTLVRGHQESVGTSVDHGICHAQGAVVLLLLLLPIAAVAATSPVVLPIEVVGADGTTASVTVDVPDAQASRVRSLRMQIHGLGYADMVSVQVNSSAWLALNNDTVTVAEPGKSYGGIGGGFATLKVTLPLPPGAVAAGTNAVCFRFNRSDGLSSGFRVLAFNFITADGEMVLPATAFSQEDPNKWTPPRSDPSDISTGKALWYGAQLVANNRPSAPAIHAHCADCHSQDGRDLKYFNFSNASIVARSQFHGLSALQGEQIASYIRELPVPNPGRPWNPPYQPGPGLDAKPASDWTAGAGLLWALDSDDASLPFIFAIGPQSPGAGVPITAETFRPDGNLNPRQIPISLQLPDWNHWLPRVHPVDAWGQDFLQSDVYTSSASVRMLLASPQLAKLISAGDIVNLFDKWNKAQRKFLTRYQPRIASEWSPDLTNKVYSTQLWQLVKAWELAQEFQLEGRGQEFYGATGEPRTWFNTIPLATAPAEANIPDGPNGMGGSALTSEYFNNAWYELQIVVNSGNHRRHGRTPIDWVYVIDRFRDMYRESHRPEPTRLLVAVIKAMQWSDPKLGPDNQLNGWRPDDTVDPRIMVSPAWALMFQPLKPDVRQAITENLLTAWLDKNLKYRTAQYFVQGATGRNYSPPKEIATISGGNVSAAAPQFEAAGVSPLTIKRLQQWGRAYKNMGESLHY